MSFFTIGLSSDESLDSESDKSSSLESEFKSENPFESDIKSESIFESDNKTEPAELSGDIASKELPSLI